MLEPTALSIGLEILKMIGGVLVPFLTIIFTIYAKKWEAAAKRKDIKDEVNRLTQLANSVDSFKLMNSEQKVETIRASIISYAAERNINITIQEIDLLIENSIQSAKRFELYGLKLMKLNKEKEQ